MNKQLLIRRISGILFIAAIFAPLSTQLSCTHKAKQWDISDTVTSLYKNYENLFKVGVAISTRNLSDSLNVVLAKQHFNSITAENAMKWDYIHPEPGRYNFEPADKFVQFGEENNMHIVGHVLIWHWQTPKWVFKDEAGNNVSRDTLLKRMHDHINIVVGRYKGKVQCWDVVNEAIDDDGSIRKNIWYNILGIDYVQKAFEFAHEADPDAVLIYNDYSMPSPVKRDGVVRLIRSLKEKGVKIDAIGMQAHYHLNFPELDDLEQSIIAFSELGCQVMITEMDINVLPKPQDYKGADVGMFFQYDSVNNPYPEALPDSMQLALANQYVSFFKIFIQHHEVIDRVTIWGIQDGSSWLNYWPVKGRSNYPLLFDRNYQPKPAFWAVADLPEKEN